MKPNDPSDLDSQDMDLTDDDLLDSDLDSFDDDEIYDDESWDDQAEAQPAAPAKKKSSAFTYGVIGVAVLIGAGILYAQFSGGEDAAPQMEISAPALPNPGTDTAPADPNSLAAIQDAPQIQDAPAIAPPPESQGGFMNDPTQLDQPGLATTPSLPDAPSMTAPDAQVADLPVPQNLPNIEQIRKADPVSEQALPVAANPDTPDHLIAAPLPAENVPLVQPATQNQAIPDPSVANPPVDVLMAKLDQISERLSALETRPAPAPSPASDNSAEVARLSEALTRLERKVDQISAAPAPARSVAAEENDAPIKVNPKPAAKPKAKAAPRKKPQSAPAGKWELRSARPGEAMVAKPGEAELKTVRVGDSVVGIGQIQSIAQSGGAWVVQGTTGSIRQ